LTLATILHFQEKAIIEQQKVEEKAADRLFGILPVAMAAEFRELWDEFEAIKTNEAMFARTIDRFQPFLHNYFTEGHMWIEYKIHAEQVQKRSAIIGKTSPQLHKIVELMISDAVTRGYLIGPDINSG